jgi:hypothetical protein
VVCTQHASRHRRVAFLPFQRSSGPGPLVQQTGQPTLPPGNYSKSSSRRETESDAGVAAASAQLRAASCPSPYPPSLPRRARNQRPTISRHGAAPLVVSPVRWLGSVSAAPGHPNGCARLMMMMESPPHHSLIDLAAVFTSRARQLCSAPAPHTGLTSL